MENKANTWPSPGHAKNYHLVVAIRFGREHEKTNERKKKLFRNILAKQNLQITFRWV